MAQGISHPTPALRARSAGPRPRPALPGGALGWLLGAAALVAVAALLITLSHARPGYDAFGWLVWGRQTLHWRLNTDGAPSWKPLTFLFTLPYSLLGRHAAAWLWVVTAWVGALAGAVFAGRVAWMLTEDRSGNRAAAWVATVLAAAGMVVMGDLTHLLLIANSDPFTATLCLVAIDCHLRGRRRSAFAVIVLVALARPEGWPFVVLYAAWLWRAEPSLRIPALAGVALVFALWFGVPALTSHNIFHAGDLAMGSPRQIHGNKIAGVVRRLRGLVGLPIQIAALAGVAWAAYRRDLTWIGLAAAATLWVIVEIAFALHGFSAAARYLLEPAAVIVVLGAAAIGRLIAAVTVLPRARYGLPVLAVGFVGLLIPFLRENERISRTQLSAQRGNATLVKRLDALIDAVGGPGAVRMCGQPVGPVGNQSLLAWELGMNVGNVGYKIGRAIRSGKPVVVFKPHGRGWSIHAWHPPPVLAARCAALRRHTSYT